MRTSIILTALFALFLLAHPSTAGLSPNDVLVVYNDSGQDEEHPGYDWTASRRVADYYCTARGIPLENEFGIYHPQELQIIEPDNFVTRIQTPIKNYLQSQFGSDPNDPSNDPIKAIVLCYGVPHQLSGYGRYGSVDENVSL